MKRYFRYFINVIRIMFWKARFGNRLNIHPLQQFRNGISLSISPKASVVIKKGISNKDGLFIIADAGSLSIGSNCFFNVNCSITCMERIEIGDNCSFANNIVVVDHDHDFRKETIDPFLSSPVIIGSNVWIGANCIILRGTKIGDNCVIAAGSVVKGDVESNMIYYQKRTTITKNISFAG